MKIIVISGGFDPIADKILIVFLLIGLSVELDSFLIAFLGSFIIAREIGIAALRDYSSKNNISDKTKVTYLAKIKTSLIFEIALTIMCMPKSQSETEALFTSRLGLPKHSKSLKVSKYCCSSSAVTH